MLITACVECAPRDRRCATCQSMRPIDHFDVRTDNWTLSSDCMACRRAESLGTYHEANDSRRAVAVQLRCNHCRKVRPRRDYYIDKRIPDGLIQPCRYCRGYRGERRRPRSRHRDLE